MNSGEPHEPCGYRESYEHSVFGSMRRASLASSASSLWQSAPKRSMTRCSCWAIYFDGVTLSGFVARCPLPCIHVGDTHLLGQAFVGTLALPGRFDLPICSAHWVENERMRFSVLIEMPQRKSTAEWDYGPECHDMYAVIPIFKAKFDGPK